MARTSGTGWFFDTAAVLRATTAAERKVLSRMGAFVRQRARSSLRKRKAVSPPGSPPSSHEGSLRKYLFFSYEPRTRSVVVGPAKLNKPGSVPHLLEHGGTAVRRGAVLTYRPRPFMAPALAAERPKFAALWKGAVTR